MTSRSSSDGRARVLEHTTVASAPLVPELPLHLMTPDQELYRGDESAAASAGVALPFWSIAWPGGQALARYLLDQPAMVRGKRVLDFGCGGALAGIAAAKSGAATVIANDVDPLALEAAKLNAELNHVVLELEGGDLIGRAVDAQVLLAADVCYEASLTARMLEWLRTVAATGCVVLIADPGRGFLHREQLEPVAEYAVGFEGDPTGQLRRSTWVGRLTAASANASDA